ncbi:MAG: trimeric intracellular cation channel family protein [Chitinophagaceae bacterium]|nr:MAG: trimeric intracellular cation channel family protein [Chitinophagaceae bacterium]
MTFVQFFIYMGVFVFALTGAFKARTYKMDILGGLVVAFATAYGGGTIRDLLIGIRPVSWINDNLALLLVFLGTFFTFLLKENIEKFRRTIFFTDALGLGLFTTTGIEVALRYGLNDGYALIMGVVTATFGGLLADIFCNAVPNLFKKGELYATACVIGGGIYLLSKRSALDDNICIAVSVLIIIAIRIYSRKKKLMLPDI